MKKILVIEESTAFADLLLKMFGDDFDVLKAQDGPSGIQTAIDNKPSIIMLGLLNSRMTPVEILRRLQLADETSSIPVIVLTDKFFEAGMQRILQREPNVFSFMDKATGIGLMVSQIEQLLGSR